MIVVVESNFVIEFAFRQEEFADAEKLIAHAENGTIELAVPACALFEPYETLVRRRKQRADIVKKLRQEITQLGRSQHFEELPDTSEAISQTLSGAAEIEHRALDHAIARLADCATVIPLSGSILKASLAARIQFSLEPQDSIVFASVDDFLRVRSGAKSVFANKNSADFSNPDIESHLQAMNCKLFYSFAKTRHYVEHVVAS